MSRKIEPVRKFIRECGVFEFQDSEQLIGGVAQLGERLPCTQEAIGSSPFTSTILWSLSSYMCSLTIWIYVHKSVQSICVKSLWPSY